MARTGQRAERQPRGFGGREVVTPVSPMLRPGLMRANSDAREFGTFRPWHGPIVSVV